MQRNEALRILQLEKSDIANREKIKENYHKLRLKYCPDENVEKDKKILNECKEKFQKVKEAQDYLLSCNYKFQEYQKSLQESSEETWKKFTVKVSPKQPELMSWYVCHAIRCNKKEELENLLRSYPNNQHGNYLNIPANYEKYDIYNGNLPLNCVSYNPSSEIIILLLREGANVNGRNMKGETLLHSLASSINIYTFDELLLCVNLLLEKGADPNIQDINGQTVLH